MSTDIPAAVPILAALIGAIAALLGIGLSFGRDWYSQKLKDGQQRTFVAIRIAAELDDFAIRCGLAAADHGEPQRQHHDDDEYIARYETPDFSLDYAAYDWRLLPKDLLMRILELPHLTKRAHAYLASVSEFAASPPYYEEYYTERSLKFGRLGLRALDVARDLRSKVGAVPDMPQLDSEDEYDARAHLELIVEDVLKSRHATSTHAAT